VGLFTEIKTLRSLKNNPYTINFYEIHETDNKIYIVLEYIEG